MPLENAGERGAAAGLGPEKPPRNDLDMTRSSSGVESAGLADTAIDRGDIQLAAKRVLGGQECGVGGQGIGVELSE